MDIDTHLYLVSAQVVPNLTPALDPEVAPRTVILLCHAGMHAQTEALTAVLKGRGISVEHWPIDDPWDLEHLQERVLELLARFSEQPGRIALNATGGTKPMSIAAYEVFRAAGAPIFYVHPELDRLIWMSPADRPNVELDNRLRLDVFLQAHGASVESAIGEAVPAARRELTAWLAANTGRLGGALKTLNWLAFKSEGVLRSPRLDEHSARDIELRTLIERLESAEVLRFEGGRLHFPDEEARFYANGGWLEEHVYDLVRALRREHQCGIQDLARSLQIVRRNQRDQPVRNELDVAFLAENRLYLIECKTRQWRNDRDQTGPGSEALFRLDVLADLLGGLQARAMLVSYHPLDKRVKRRAADLRIQVCDGAKLAELGGVLARWTGC